MYSVDGFRKVITFEAANLKTEKDDVEFAHPCFVQGQEGLLEFIKRKASMRWVEEPNIIVSVSLSLSALCIYLELAYILTSDIITFL